MYYTGELGVNPHSPGININRTIREEPVDLEKTYDSLPLDRGNGLTILIVDDEELGRVRVGKICEDLGPDYKILFANTLPEAFNSLLQSRVHVVLLDKTVGPNEADLAQNGIEAIPEMLKLQPHLQILMITGSKDFQDAVAATQNGAFGYVTKDTPEKLLISHIQKAVQMATLMIENERLDRTKQDPDDIALVGSSSAIARLKAEISDVVQSDRPILLLGETGTGKTTIAKLIHDSRKKYLRQKNRPLVPVNIAALPASLIEGELFGSERGSYTGSVASKPGLFELADSGTLFLDEIGEIPLDIQKKLLTVVETGVFRRVGGSKELKSNFRLVCATNRDLEEMVQVGTFREDLYLRLSTFPIRVPSLKERTEDVPEIIKSILPKCAKENRVQVSFEELPKEFIEHLKRDLPKGNIRGLEQQISRLLIHSPKDRNGRPLLRKWKSTGIFLSSAERPSRSISLDELLSCPLDLVSPKFPGLTAFIESLESRILLDTKAKLKSNKNVAQALKMSQPLVSIKLKRLGHLKERGIQ